MSNETKPAGSQFCQKFGPELPDGLNLVVYDGVMQASTLSRCGSQSRTCYPLEAIDFYQ